jgi:hypothetical protein
MSRVNVISLHSAFEQVRKWPVPVREEVLRWLAPGVLTALRRHVPVAATIATASQPTETWPEVWRPPARQRRPPKPKPDCRPHKPDKVRILELELLEAMQGHPGASVAPLAAIVGSGKSKALWTLHRLAERGEIEKDADSHWRLAERRETTPSSRGSAMAEFEPRA